MDAESLEQGLVKCLLGIGTDLVTTWTACLHNSCSYPSDGLLFSENTERQSLWMVMCIKYTHIPETMYDA